MPQTDTLEFHTTTSCWGKSVRFSVVQIVMIVN